MRGPATTAPKLAAGLLSGVVGLYCAVVKTTEPGIVAGLDLLDPTAAPAPVGEWKVLVRDGDAVAPGAILVEVRGTASEIGVAEDYVVGPLGFASGIATRARMFADACPPGLRIACGGWKKLPAALKPLLRAGLAATGVLPRLVEGDFIYVNKNAVKLIGSVAGAIAAGRALEHGPVAVQVRNILEAEFAVRAGAGIIMVDTALLEDLEAVNHELTRLGLRDRVMLAFGGGVRLEDLKPAYAAGAQAVDVGRAILNAPLLDLRLEVVS